MTGAITAILGSVILAACGFATVWACFCQTAHDRVIERRLREVRDHPDYPGHIVPFKRAE